MLNTNQTNNIPGYVFLYTFFCFSHIIINLIILFGLFCRIYLICIKHIELKNQMFYLYTYKIKIIMLPICMNYKLKVKKIIRVHMYLKKIYLWSIKPGIKHNRIKCNFPHMFKVFISVKMTKKKKKLKSIILFNIFFCWKMISKSLLFQNFVLHKSVLKLLKCYQKCGT